MNDSVLYDLTRTHVQIEVRFDTGDRLTMAFPKRTNPDSPDAIKIAPDAIKIAWEDGYMDIYHPKLGAHPQHHQAGHTGLDAADTYQVVVLSRDPDGKTRRDVWRPNDQGAWTGPMKR